MALINPPGLYSGGNVVVDSSPSVDLYARLMQRREQQEAAKQEAFDSYIRGLNTKINPAGKRTVDDPAFKHFYDKWQKFGIDNKQRLQRGDIAAQSEFNALYQDIENMLSESKQAEEAKKPAVDIMIDPNKRDKISDAFLQSIQSHDQPLYIQDKDGSFIRNPNRKAIDFTQNIYDPSLDLAKHYEQISKGYKMDEAIGNEIRRNADTGTIDKELILSYSPDTKKQIATNAMLSVDADPKVGNYYQYRFSKMKENEFKELNKIYQDTYGKTIKLPNGSTLENYIDSPQKLAAAEALKEASVIQRKERSFLDRGLMFRNAQSNIILNHSFGGNPKPPFQWNLSGYPSETDGGKNVTVPFQGYTFTDILGSKYGAKKVVYYPDRKEFKVTEYTGRNNDGSLSGEKTYTIDAQTLRQNIQGSNPQIDMKMFDDLIQTTGAQQQGAQGGGGIFKGAAGVRTPKEIGKTKMQPQYSNMQSGTMNGKKVTIGQKNGKWYNVETGEEIK